MKRLVLAGLIALAGLAAFGVFACSAEMARPGCAALESEAPACGFIAESRDGTIPRADGRFAYGRADEELWVIARPKTAPPKTDPKDSPKDKASDGRSAQSPKPATAAAEQRLRSGTLLARRATQSNLEVDDVPMPLRHTDVKATVLGFVATVDVCQQFHNPYDTKIEAVYVFPLPHDGAVQEFVMMIGERRIRGVIREREQAETIYREARARGHVAALMTQERPNVFTQAVANLEPGKRVDVTIRYFHTLAYDDGWHELVFPMVVGPRYNPPSMDTGEGLGTGIGAVARGAHGTSGHATEVPYLAPHERSGHDVALAVELDAGVAIEELVCSSHRVETRREGERRARVTLAADERIPNRDFVLRYRVAGERLKTALVTQQTEQGSWFTLMLYPPRAPAAERAPVELIFVIDCSGSMAGEPIAQARAAVDAGLGALGSGDTFQVLSFSDHASALGNALLPASPQNKQRAREHVAALPIGGGTRMDRGIQAAFQFARGEGRQRMIAFLTDGFIGNDDEILAMVARGAGDARLFSFGIGSAPNRHLLEGMARLGRGAVAYVGPGDEAAGVMQRALARMSQPVLTDIRVQCEGDGQGISDVFPQRLTDLFAGRPLFVTGRYRGEAPRLQVRGRAGKEVVTWTPEGAEAAKDGALGALWARMKIASLMDGALQNEGRAPEKGHDQGRDLETQIRTVALEFGLLSPFTAFLAVDSTQVTAGEHGVTVPVAVPVPAGVRYDTTVGRHSVHGTGVPAGAERGNGR